jgi:MFS superfamily sulfate permease-like transporter
MFDLPNFSTLKNNLLSGLTVSLALVPEAIAFALVAHVAPWSGSMPRSFWHSSAPPSADARG